MAQGLRQRSARLAFALLVMALGAVAFASTASAAGRCGSHPWCDTSLAPEQRTDLLLAALTLEEKLSLMAGDDPSGVFTGVPATGTSNGVPRLDVPTVFYSDGPVGPREGQATQMPSPLALAASFDPALAERVGRAIADEVKKKGNDVVHAPTVDLMRTPLAGRTFEGYGEDPWLSSRLGVEWIRGAQAEGVVGNVKHYAPNSQEGAPPGVPPLTPVVGGRFTVDSIVDERTLREIYLPPFEAAVKEAQVGSVMCAYNRLNGAPACESRELLERILRQEWGFPGYVLSDYGFATKSTAGSANNGLDLDLPLGGFYSVPALAAAVGSGQVSPATIDARVGAILRTMFRFGLFDRADFPSDDGLIDKAGHAAVAREVAEQGTVLLKNDGALPLDPGRLRSIAVIGVEAAANKSGGGSSAVRPFSSSVPRDEIAARAGPGVEVRYEPGDDRGAAVGAARGADVAIVFASDTATEGVDKACLALDCPAGSGRGQDALIDAVAEANPSTVVVLETAGPVLTPWRDRVEAVLEAWYPGQDAGRAIASVLFGDVDPGGRLPVSFPRREADAPAMGDPEQYPGIVEVRHKEGVFIGYRHYDSRGIEPAFAFGHGLSYSRFDYSGLRIDRRPGGAATVSALVRNAGERTASEVAQLYLGLPEPSAAVRQPPLALKGARKLALEPGARRRVTFRLDRRALSYWNVQAHGWAVAPGCYRVMVGRSSRDIRLRGAFAVGGARCGSAPRRCLARRSPIGPGNVGRIALGLSRARLSRRLDPVGRAPFALRWCVRGSGRRVTAVFSRRSRRGRARLVVTRAPSHGNRRIRPGASARRLRRAYRRSTRVRRAGGRRLTVLRAGRGSRRVFGVQRGRVRFIAVADRRLLRRPGVLRRYVRRASR